jgi:anaerobic sulfite reductase subunit C
MKWNEEAEKSVSKAPFFVRRRIRKRIEEEARKCNLSEVTLEHVQSCRKKFLENMEDEVRGYRLEGCFGSSGCPNSLAPQGGLLEKVEILLAQKNLREFLKSRVKGPLKMHHEFSASVSDCPNACSRPQIVDIGIIGAVRPDFSEETCTRCNLCVEICSEDAVSLAENSTRPEIDCSKCVACGKCVASCPTGYLVQGMKGFRILLGGKLGRHPQLGREIDGIFSEDMVLKIIEQCLIHLMDNSIHGERFGDILNRTGPDFLGLNYLIEE